MWGVCGGGGVGVGGVGGGGGGGVSTSSPDYSCVSVVVWCGGAVVCGEVVWRIWCVGADETV